MLTGGLLLVQKVMDFLTLLNYCRGRRRSATPLKDKFMDPISEAIVAALQPVANANNIQIDYSFTPAAPAPITGVVTPVPTV